jgi:DNA-binding LytR/AlgR family response regulator
MTMTAIIIDDEPLAHDVILEYLKEVDWISVRKQFYSATDALVYLTQNTIDLIFLDINMPKLNGMDFLKILSQKTQVIVTSAYQEYALESFELDVCDYLLKPFRFDRFIKAVTKANEQFQLTAISSAGSAMANIGDHSQEDKKESSIFLKVDRKLIQFELADIIYLEAYGNYVKIWIDSKSFLTPRTLTSFEKQLNSEEFMRVHKSFIVQKKKINFFEGSSIHMSNNNQVSIGKSYKHLAKLLS